MRLVIYGRESIEELRVLASSKFEAVKNKDLNPPKYGGASRLFAIVIP